jgi:hypothetical protein
MTEVRAMAEATAFHLPRYVEVETSRGRGAHGGGSASPEAAGAAAPGSRQELMAWPLFDKIVRELGELGYAGWWAFHHCSEPLLNPRLVREVEHVRALVPGARPAIHTSGDLLTPGLLVDLLQLGAGYVRITRYPRHPRDEPAYEPVRQWLIAGGLLESLPWRFVEMRHGWAAVYERDGLRVDVIRPRLAPGAGAARYPAPAEAPHTLVVAPGADGEAGAVAGHAHGPGAAQHPPDTAVIDCSGEVAACRNVFGDVPGCGRHTIGNLQERSFADLWSSPTLSAFHDRSAGAEWSPWPTEGILTERFPAVPA